MICVALMELCQVWENNPVDAIILDLETSNCNNRKPLNLVQDFLKDREIYQAGKCRMSVFGAWTKCQDICLCSTNFNNSFQNMSLSAPPNSWDFLEHPLIIVETHHCLFSFIEKWPQLYLFNVLAGAHLKITIMTLNRTLCSGVFDTL